MKKKSNPPAFLSYVSTFMESVFSPLLNIIDGHIPSDQQSQIIQEASVSLANADIDFILPLLLFKTDSPLMHQILRQTIQHIDDVRFQNLLSAIKEIGEARRDEHNNILFTPENIAYAYEILLANNPRGNQRQIPESQEMNKQLKENQLLALFQAELDDFMHKKLSASEKIAIMKSLSDKIVQWLKNKRINKATIAIEALVKGIYTEEEGNLRLELLKLTILITDLLMNSEYVEIVIRISHQYIRFIKAEKQISPSIIKVMNQLKELVIRLIKEQRYNETGYILETLFILMTRPKHDNIDIGELAKKTIEEIVNAGVIEILLDEFQTDRHDQRKYVGYLLPKFGGAAVEPLLLMLQDSPSRTERARIIQAIIDIGPFAAPELASALQEAEEWYYIRNIILLLGEVGDETYLDYIKPFFNFRDIRVRREAVKSIAQIGGDKKEGILIPLLESADLRMKSEAATALGKIKSLKAVPYFIKILESIFEEGDRDCIAELAEKIIVALGAIGSAEAIPVLNHIMRHERMFKASLVSDQLIGAALDALDNIKQFDDHQQQYLQTYQISVEELQRSTEVELSAAPNNKNLKPVDQTVIDLWPELFQQLTDSQAQSLYGFMKPCAYREDSIIYTQGGLNNEIYFIQEGELVLAYNQGQIIRPFGKKEVEGWLDEEVWIKTLYKGDISGQDTFFMESVYTTSMRSLTPVTMLSLHKSDFERLTASFPDFEQKFKTFCHDKNNLSAILDQYGMERRIDLRVRVSGELSLQFLNADTTPKGEPMTVMVTDISTGGLCCQTRIYAKSSAHFADTRVLMKFILNYQHEKLFIEQTGTVVSFYKVNDQKDFRIHLKFDVIPVELLEIFPLSDSVILEDPYQKQHNQTFLKTVLPL